MTHDVECALDSLLQTAGLGGLGYELAITALATLVREVRA